MSSLRPDNGQRFLQDGQSLALVRQLCPLVVDNLALLSHLGIDPQELRALPQEDVLKMVDALEGEGEGVLLRFWSPSLGLEPRFDAWAGVIGASVVGVVGSALSGGISLVFGGNPDVVVAAA